MKKKKCFYNIETRVAPTNPMKQASMVVTRKQQADKQKNGAKSIGQPKPQFSL
jgi:hypothetical protein